ncbi:cell division protein PerM (plasmid) [Coraliomargarita sp. W4R53]
MNRLIVLLLAAVDATIAVAVGVAAILAPLTVMWVFALPGADWSALWTTAGTIWQFSMLAPLAIDLPAEYVAALALDSEAASFVLSLAPLALAAFMTLFGARSGVRASKAEAWITGVTSGTLVVTALAAVIALTARNDVASVSLWQVVLFPALLFGLSAVAGAVITEWREAGTGVIAALRERCARAGDEWALAPALVVRGSSVVVAGMLGAGAVLTAVAFVLRSGEIVALYQSSNVDGLGAALLTLAQLAYLPSLIVWALAFIAGPGIALGAGSVVAPAGTTSGIVPGIPLFGALPEATSPWLLLLALVPVALGVFAGWIARSELARAHTARPSAMRFTGGADEKMGPRLAIAAGITAVSAASCALLAALAAGSIGPGRLAQLGPESGPVALAVGLEVALGVSILLLSPRREQAQDSHPAEHELVAPLD